MGRRRVEMGEKVNFVKKGQTVEISNSYELLRFDLASGIFSIFLNKRKGVSITHAYACIVLGNGDRIKTTDKWAERTWRRDVQKKEGEGYGLSFRVFHSGFPRANLKNSSLVLSIDFFSDTPAVLLRVELINDCGEPLVIKELQPLVVEAVEGGTFDLGSNTKSWRFLKHGYHTSSPCYSLSLTELDKTCPVEFFRKDFNPHSKRNAAKGEFDSEWMTAFKDNRTGNSAVIGFVTMKDNMCQIDFKVDKEEREISGMWARSISDDVVCTNGEHIKSEKLLLDLLGPISKGLDRYSGRVALEMNALPWKRTPTGWCSWYEFFDDISEDLILRVTDYYRENREKYPIEYIQIDDGYFTRRGDWTTPNAKFPHGMKYVAGKIKQAGFKPAIWLAPFDVSTESKLFKEHPDWLVKTENGKPVEHDLEISVNHGWCGLDCTNPAVVEWLKSLFKTVTQDWGYEFLKLDFLYAAATDGTRYDRNATRAQALRGGLEVIREAVGDKVLILGCLAPLGVAVGLVNTYRVSPDNATRWNAPWPFDNGASMRDAMRNTILRYFMHNKFWTNDPDCIIARRGKDRSEYPKSAEIEYLSKGGTLSESEVRFEFTVLGILGGVLFYSDDPFRLPAERERYLPLVLPPFQGKARVVDLLENDLPGILHLRIEKEYGDVDLVGLLNWSDLPKDIEFRFVRIGLQEEEAYHVFSFWDEKYLGKVRDKVAVNRIAPHSASLLSIRNAHNIPELISSTIHVTQGGAEVDSLTWTQHEKRLEIKLIHPGKRTGKLFIYVPSPFKFDSITSDYAEIGVTEPSNNELLVVGVSFSKTARISVKFT